MPKAERMPKAVLAALGLSEVDVNSLDMLAAVLPSALILEADIRINSGKRKTKRWNTTWACAKFQRAVSSQYSVVPSL